MYCFVGDLSGFQSIILNLAIADQETRINQWIDLVKSATEKCQLEDFSLIADNVIVIADENEDGIECLIEFSKVILENGMKLKLPIRGAISKGDVKRSDQIFFGKALIDAYKLAINQNWIGVSLSTQVDRIEHCWDIDKLILYPPPLKNGIIHTTPVISWKIPRIEELLKFTSSGGLFKKNEPLPWDYGMKIQNTAIFSLYIKTIKKLEEESGKKANIKQFHGLSPLQIIEMMIEGVPMKIN